MKKAKLQIKKSKDGQQYLSLTAANGENLLTGETLKNGKRAKGDVLDAMMQVLGLEWVKAGQGTEKPGDQVLIHHPENGWEVVSYGSAVWFAIKFTHYIPTLALPTPPKTETI